MVEDEASPASEFVVLVLRVSHGLAQWHRIHRNCLDYSDQGSRCHVDLFFYLRQLSATLGAVGPAIEGPSLREEDYFLSATISQHWGQ